VIQEAAHEEANIIFGAVVDPKMEGKVKITVIATGFDRETPKITSASAAQTPVDLHSYTNWKQENGDKIAAAGGSRMTFSRRAVLELPVQTAAAAQEEPSTSPGAEFEPVSPLDVPAFLRRQSEA
jgi:cell division protein FtsZ